MRNKPPVTAAAAPASPARQAILDTAARLFRRDGYAAVSVRDIAGACGIRAASLYYHFPSKDDIVAEVLRVGVQTTFDEVRRAVAALPADAAPQAVLRTAIRAHLDAMFRMSDFTIANLRIHAQVPEHVRTGHAGLRDDYEAWWAGLFARLAQAGACDPGRNLQLARFFTLGAMNAALEWFRPGGLSIEAVADEMADLLLQGLLPRARSVAQARRLPRSGMPASPE